MVRDNRDGRVRTNQPRTHIAEGLHDSEELLVVHLVVDLSGRELPREVGDRVEEPKLVGLMENTCDSKIGSVSSERGGKTGVEMAKKRRGGDGDGMDMC